MASPDGSQIRSPGCGVLPVLGLGELNVGGSAMPSKTGGVRHHPLPDPRVAARDISGPVFVCRDDPGSDASGYVGVVDKRKHSDHCIEWRTIIDTSFFCSVPEYEAALRLSRSLSNDKAKTFHGGRWADGAPRVESLKLEWQQIPEYGRIRICDWDIYDKQMRELIGVI
jgi:hypothetical protein